MVKRCASCDDEVSNCKNCNNKIVRGYGVETGVDGHYHFCSLKCVKDYAVSCAEKITYCE